MKKLYPRDYTAQKEKFFRKWLRWIIFTKSGNKYIPFQKVLFRPLRFFLYLINLLVTFGVLLILAFYYIYCIFYKYYQELEIECSLFFECNILSLASGVQIKNSGNTILKPLIKKIFWINIKTSMLYIKNIFLLER